jgi:hypothetical protein
MAISGISSYSNAYQSTVQVPTQRNSQQAQDASSAKNITRNPVNAATNKTDITPQKEDNNNNNKNNEGSTLGSKIDVRA